MFKELLNKISGTKKSVQTTPKIVVPEIPKTIELEVSVKHNSQLNNKTFSLIKPSSQCAYTTIAMVLSRFLPQANFDEFISDMILNFENGFLAGKGSRFALTMDNHVKIYEYYINKYELKKRVVFIPHGATIQDIINGLRAGSAIEFSWKPTPHGHYSAIIGFSELKKSLLIQDPYAKYDFTKKTYSRESGERNWHSIEQITLLMNKSSKTGKGYRILYLGDL